MPADVVQSITQLVQKLGTLKDNRAKLDAALKRLDGDVGALRDRDENARAIAVELTKWLNDLNDPKKSDANEARKEGVRKDDVFQGLFAATDIIRDGNDFLRATRLAEGLRKTLSEGRFKIAEQDPLAGTLATLSVDVEKFLKDRPLRVHIISAKYGVLGTSRTCDAKWYFRAKCEGQARCPVPTGTATDASPFTISGGELCGGEPAPLADPAERKALVAYKCIRFGMRPWAEIERTESSGGASLEFVGKGQITCDVR